MSSLVVDDLNWLKKQFETYNHELPIKKEILTRQITYPPSIRINICCEEDYL